MRNEAKAKVCALAAQCRRAHDAVVSRQIAQETERLILSKLLGAGVNNPSLRSSMQIVSAAPRRACSCRILLRTVRVCARDSGCAWASWTGR